MDYGLRITDTKLTLLTMLGIIVGVRCTFVDLTQHTKRLVWLRIVNAWRFVGARSLPRVEACGIVGAGSGCIYVGRIRARGTVGPPTVFSRVDSLFPRANVLRQHRVSSACKVCDREFPGLCF
ncbi:hypothetical protein C8R44DRAFT_193342 [Mycena epipterygia]|nr:hypothetical protein C8R44DRAFT_193342 [Mycena epipterygia]